MPTFVRTQEIEHEIGERGSFGLRVTSSDVEMAASRGTTARVRATFEIRAASDAEADDVFARVRLLVVEGAGRLEVSEPRDGAAGLASLVRLLAGGGTKVDASIDVEAPAGCDLRFEGVSADLTTRGFAGAQHYRTVSGDLVLEGVGGDVRIKAVSGDISLRTDEPLSALEVSTVSGDVSATSPRVEQLRIVTVSGDAEIETVLADGTGHRVETVSGDFSLGVVGGLTAEVRGLSTDADVRLPHRAEGSRDRRRFVIGAGGPSLLFSSMSGDLSIWPARRITPPTPPAPPTAPAPATTPPPPAAPPASGIGEGEQLEVLRALERGEIDVEEAARRLAGDESGRA
jgi:Putative adhesin